MNNPKTTPFTCCCYATFRSEQDFFNHLMECFEYRNFKETTEKIITLYGKYKKYDVNLEDLR